MLEQNKNAETKAIGSNMNMHSMNTNHHIGNFSNTKTNNNHHHHLNSVNSNSNMNSVNN